MEGIIYKFTNKINGKIYIGQTVNEKRRYREHKKAKGNSYFHIAIRKYNGIENFDYEVLFRGDESLLDEKEIYYISLYNSTDNRFGYNISLGGGSFMRGKHLSQEHKDKISEANKGTNGYWYGKHLSQETKDKISKTRIAKGLAKGINNPFYGVHKYGKNNHNYGRHISQEQKDKISAANKGPNSGVYHKYNLLEYENNIYSTFELAKVIGCIPHSIYNHIKAGQDEFKVKGHLIKVIKKA